MNGRLSHWMYLFLAAQISACTTSATVNNLADSQPSNSATAGVAAQWQGASISELIAIMGSPSETMNALPEYGLSSTVSWYSNSEDYMALELLEVESAQAPERIPVYYGRLADGHDSHECQIHAKLSTDGLRVEELTQHSIGDCDRWLPIPDRNHLSAPMTVAVDE